MPEDRLRLALASERSRRDLTPLNQQCRICPPSGAIKWLLFRATPQRMGEDCVWSGICIDITAQQDAAEALEKARDAAQGANRAKSAFLATMSHEIRTPLNGVIGMTSLLLDTPLNEEQREFVETARSSGESLLGLINDILDYSKIEADRIDLEAAPVDLFTVVEEACDMVLTKTAEKGLELMVDPSFDVPRWFEGDAPRPRPIRVTLLSNAVKSTESGDITVRWQADEEGFTADQLGI